MTEAAETLKNRAYDSLKQMILSGRLRPGQKLAERELTEELKVSRTPIREALSRLVQEGLVISSSSSATRWPCSRSAPSNAARNAVTPSVGT